MWNRRAKKLKVYLETLNHCDFCKHYDTGEGYCSAHKINSAWESVEIGCGELENKYEFDINAATQRDTDIFPGAELPLSLEEWDSIK